MTIARFLQDIGLLVVVGAALWTIMLPVGALLSYRQHVRRVRR